MHRMPFVRVPFRRFCCVSVAYLLRPYCAGGAPIWKVSTATGPVCVTRVILAQLATPYERYGIESVGDQDASAND